MRLYGRPFKSMKIWHWLLANAGLAILILLIFFNNVFESPHWFFLGFIWSYSICITQWAGPMLIGYLLDKRLKWIEKPVARTFIEISSLLVWSVSAFVIVQMIMLYLINGIAPAEAWQYIYKSIVYTFLISLFISLIFTSIGFFRAWRASVLNEAALKTEMMSYKYEALRNQINPHFLFNSFNVLSDLVYDDQAQAVKFIRHLSELFRYVLDSRDKELVPIGDELEFMKSYTGLLKTRFGEKLNLNINLTKENHFYIVPMTLQMLVENAVKHNEVSEKFPLRVDIRQEADYLEVKNAVQLKQAGDNSKNTGLKNISQQYGFFTERPVQILRTETEFMVRIPLLQIAEK